jgi:hypothetical protein
MKEMLARSRRRRIVASAVAIGSVGVLAASCTNPGGGMPWRTTTTWTQPTSPPTTDCHGHTGDDHNNLKTTTTMDMDHGGGGDHHAPGVTFPPCNGGGATTTMPGMDHGGDGHHESPARLNHPPTAAQKKWAEELVSYTKTALQKIPNKATATRLGYNDIGDGQHFTHPKYRIDGRELDPRYIESLVFNRVTGQIQAAMYNMEPTTTAANVHDYAGNWVIWHGHDNLCWGAPENQVNSPGWTRLAGVKVNGKCTAGSYAHTPVPMLHVWVVDTTYENRCGAFASIDGLGPGACVQSFQQNNIPARPIPASFPYKP